MVSHPVFRCDRKETLLLLQNELDRGSIDPPIPCLGSLPIEETAGLRDYIRLKLDTWIFLAIHSAFCHHP
jgi:hypothetical protein